MKKQKSNRSNIELSIDIEAPMEKIFPLACPVEELKWINNWDYTMVYSESGINELGCIFFEEMSARHVVGPGFHEKTFWYTVEYEPDTGLIHFLLVRSSSITDLIINMETIENNLTKVKWNMTITSIDEKANVAFDDNIKDRMKMMLSFLAQSLKHYCETGAILGARE